MISFEYNDPEAQAELQRALSVIDTIGQLDDQLSSDVETFAPSDSDLGRLSARFPDSPVNLTRSLRAALTTTRGSLDQIADSYTGPTTARRITLQSAVRSALLGAGRVVFVLAPRDPSERSENALTALRQETASLTRALEASSGFRHLVALRPDPPLVAEARRWNEHVKQLQKGPLSEGLVLRTMAQTIGQEMVTSGRLDEDDLTVLVEAVTWIWHTYSGEAHGYGWPALASGEFVADLGTTTSVAHFAFDLAVKATTTSRAAPA